MRNPPGDVISRRAKSPAIQSQLAAIVDSSDDAIISKNLDGVISTWNAAAERLFGYSARESIGQSILMIVPPELHEEEMQILARLRSGERIEHYETRRVTRDGRLLDVSLTISPVRDASGAVVGFSKILRDITDRKHLQAHARILQAISTGLISESSPGSLYGQILDAAMHLMDSDAASVQMLAADQESLTLFASRNFHPDSAAFWHRVDSGSGSTCGQALRDNRRVLVPDIDRCEFMAGTRDLEEYRRSGLRAVQSTPLRSRSGRPLGMISTHWKKPRTPTEQEFRLFDVLARQAADLIERARGEAALRESEQRFRLVADTAPVMIWMTDADGQCTYVSQSALAFDGRPVDVMLGTGWARGIHPDDLERTWTGFTNATERRKPFEMEYRFRRHDGEYRWVVGSGVPRYDVDGSFAGYIGSAIDITERKQAQAALSTLSQWLIQAQEEERAHLARELHDDIMQQLSLLGLRLGELAHGKRTTLLDVQRQIDEAHRHVEDLVKDVQALSHRLHPPRLEYLGIAAAADALCREISSQHAISVHFRADTIPDGLSKRVVVCLYRVLQESLQNAIKHSGSTSFDVSLLGRADRIELSIRDYGVGFDARAAQGSGLGLTSMSERLKAVGGQLEILSEPEQGTTIRASVPLPQSHGDQR